MSKEQKLVAAARSAIVAMLVVSVRQAAGTPIDDPAFFGTGAVTIDFETFPGSGKTLPPGTPFTDEFGYGVLFRSEEAPGALQTTDPGDVAGRFEAPWRILDEQGINGGPISGIRMASGDEYLGLETSDMRIDFSPSVSAFGFFLIDNDFTNVRITAYDAAGVTLEVLIAPQVNEGGMSYRGISLPDPLISYVIIDAQNGSALDSSFIDDLSIALTPPCPADLDGSGIVGVADLLLVLAQWGPCPPECVADADNDGAVGVLDLLEVLGQWGPCPAH